MKNQYRGESCYVIGNGPSLRDEPNSKLLSLPTFGTNRIYKKLNPAFYVCVNPLVIEQNKREIAEMIHHSLMFVRADMGLPGYQLRKSLQAPFSYEPLQWINEGYTVTYVCLQLAYWMGFSTVKLVGVDHRYTFEGNPNETKQMQGDDPNHFDPGYFRGQQWQNPDLANSEKYYRIAKSIFEADGRRIINITPNSALDVFEKGDD